MSACAYCSISPDRTSFFTEIAVANPQPKPLTPGHSVVVSRRHVNRFLELDAEEQQMASTPR
jgi:diadenosine tetraphosphate (Ap4A) HIT family hydrolase